MSRIVQKFGGSSLSDTEHMRRVADIIASTLEKGHEVAVVVSAMYGDTDRLISMAQSIAAESDKREYAALVSTGEQVSASLLAMLLNSREIKARSYTGYQAGIVTEGGFKKAQIVSIATDAIGSDLAQNVVPVVAGFQGVDAQGNITTLGRGGSDTTAVALAVALKADECQIFTDVEGVFTADPNVFAGARCIPKLDFRDMLEVSSLGAKVLQSHAIDVAARHHMPLKVLSSFSRKQGTVIAPMQMSHMMENKPYIVAITHRLGAMRFSIMLHSGQQRWVSEIMRRLSETMVHVDMIHYDQSSGRDMIFTLLIYSDDHEQVVQILSEPKLKTHIRQINVQSHLAKLSVVGTGLQRACYTEVTSAIMGVLTHADIKVHMTSTAETKVSVVLDEEYLRQGVHLLHQAFKLHEVDLQQIESAAPIE